MARIENVSDMRIKSGKNITDIYFARAVTFVQTIFLFYLNLSIFETQIKTVK